MSSVFFGSLYHVFCGIKGSQQVKQKNKKQKVTLRLGWSKHFWTLAVETVVCQDQLIKKKKKTKETHDLWALELLRDTPAERH